MPEYTGPIDDIEFVLFDLLDAQSEWARIPAFEGFERETVHAVVAECAKLASEAMAPLFDAVAEALESEGYKVERIPFLSNLPGVGPGSEPPPRPYRQVLDYPVLSYNNVVLGSDADDATVYMPRYGFAALDRGAESAWRKLGFTVKGVDGFATSALYGGALRCTLKVLERR